MIQVELEETDKVTECLNNHGIVAFPTDTVFGLGCLRDDTEAIDKIDEAFVLNISAKSLRKLWKNHKNNLLDLNLRYYVKNKNIDE